MTSSILEDCGVGVVEARDFVFRMEVCICAWVVLSSFDFIDFGKQRRK